MAAENAIVSVMGLRLQAASGNRGTFWFAAFASVWCCMILCSSSPAQTPFRLFEQRFVSGYEQLNIPQVDYDYREYFSSVPSLEKIEAQQRFFLSAEAELTTFDKRELHEADRDAYALMAYEVAFNLRRIELEKAWVEAGRKIPVNGLSGMEDGKAWYALFVKRYTSTDITPEEVYELGLSEVTRVKQEIKRLQSQLGFNDSIAFYKHLGDSSFFITDKQEVLRGFSRIDSIVRKKLNRFIGLVVVPPVYAMEWPEVGAGTPPGIYLNHAFNPYGKDVFQFNFYNKRYNRRTMEWLYMHEAIPGHHLQFSLRNAMPLQELFLYPGNFEGWACYVEYHGNEVGLYTDPYAELGKWEWDLVRSARLVMDAGIHYYGWTREQALAYWKQNIPAQDDIAEREVTRVINWAAQALSYKVGADFISGMRGKWEHQNPHQPVSAFHNAFLDAGNLPLVVTKQKLLKSYAD